MTEITYNNLPEAVTQLRADISEIKRLLLSKRNEHQPEADRWFSIDELCEYLPGHPAKCSIYGWVHFKKIPYNKFGKRLAFRKSQIDFWLMSGQRKTNAELEQEANNHVALKK